MRSIRDPTSAPGASLIKSATDRENAAASLQRMPMLGLALPCSRATTVPLERPVTFATRSSVRPCSRRKLRSLVAMACPSSCSRSERYDASVIILTLAASRGYGQYNDHIDNQ